MPATQAWISNGRSRQYVASTKMYLPGIMQAAETPIGKRVYPKVSIDQIQIHMAQLERMLIALGRLPVCFCHHDAFKNNHIDHVRSDGQHETVAIDWAITGFGRIGEEIGVTTNVSLDFLCVPSSDARLLDEAVFTGYLNGLRDAGWQSDPRLARLGYTICISCMAGLGYRMSMLYILQEPGFADSSRAGDNENSSLAAIAERVAKLGKLVGTTEEFDHRPNSQTHRNQRQDYEA